MKKTIIILGVLVLALFLVSCTNGTLAGEARRTPSSISKDKIMIACTDSDGGINYYVKAITEGADINGIGISRGDSCVTSGASAGSFDISQL